MNDNKQQFWTVDLLFMLIVSALTSACDVTPVNVAVLTPTVAAVRLAVPTAVPTATVSPIAPPTAIPKIDFPLALNDNWVFQSTRYQGYPIPEIMTATLIITETVVYVENISPYFVAEIHQDQGAETPVSIPKGMESILRPATSGEYWLIVNGSRLYRQENKLDLSKLNEALIELVFPLRPGAMWYQTDEKAQLNPTFADNWMLRKVTKVDTVVVPAGRFNDCFLLEEEWAGTTFATWFCPNVGIVDRKVDHQGTPEGYHQVLVKHQLK